MPEDCKTLFQAKLKPVSNSNPVAAPIMEVPVTHVTSENTNDARWQIIALVGNDAGHAKCSSIGCRGLVAQNVFTIEYVQPLIFHRAHGEIWSGDDVVLIKT